MEKNLKPIDLIKKSKQIRLEFIKLIYNGFKFHIGGTLSCVDVIVALFYANFINLNKKKRNIFILSKGHALACFFLILMDKKKISYDEFKNNFEKLKFGNQLDIYNSKFVDWNTGSLGHSAGVAIGLAIKNPSKKIYVIVGDAEFEEGSIWEAIFYISENKIKNIALIIDRNKMSASSFYEKKEVFDKNILEKLNFNILKINGHNFKNILKSLKVINKSKKSSILIANTIKGKGFKIFENNRKYSHELPSKEILEKIIYE
tara:strand:+ start:8756 stop:9535 length:780 start_codon:yes stop_codon:yes gene_type:complete